MTKICVCGRSKTYPVCDNSHESEDWSCQPEPQWSEIGFCASPAYTNLALKLSAFYEGILCDDLNSTYQVQTLVLLVESSQLEKPIALFQKISTERVIVVGLGVGSAFLRRVFTNAEVHALEELKLSTLFSQVKKAIDGPVVTSAKTRKDKSLFLSHAIKDESLISPAIHYLKMNYDAQIFSCQDSISEGKNWHESIIKALANSDSVVVLISKAMLDSTFCAFEIGYALALDKELRLISLDGSIPPSYIQHLHMTNLERQKVLKPWLSIRDLLIEHLLSGI